VIVSGGKIMIDELDISQEKAVYDKLRAQRVIENLQKRSMNGYYASNRAEALSIAMGLIPEGVVVARGDSMSVEQIGLLAEIIRRDKNALIDPFETDGEGHWPEESKRQRMMRETFFADVFITSTNAITLDGKLVNIDGAGNRVSAMIFGPAKVILIVGVNKIVKDAEAALERIHQIAAPINAQRHYLKHHAEKFANLPCVKTGSCIECRHENKICNYTVTIDGAMPQHKGRINVVLVNEELGI
jgi:L-lactate utilization protein LutB